MFQCDGQRPECSQCGKRASACFYATKSSEETRNMALRREVGELKKNAKLFDNLVSLPENAAIALLRRLRSPSLDPTLAKAAVGNIVSGTGLSLAALLPPPIQSSLEFELMMRHPISYPYPAPVAQSWGKDRKLVPEPGPVLPTYCDDRLVGITIKDWTQVPISNDLAARLISFFLETDHPILGLFDADLFLDDFVAGRTRFCSNLLVSSVLYYASVSTWAR